MSIYGNRYTSSARNALDEAADVVENVDALQESYIAYELSKLDDEDRKAFIESDECKAMLEKGQIGRRTIIRLSKNDDISRRTKMAAFQIAKEKNDPLWQKLILNRTKERILIRKIVDKYGMKAQKAAKVGQREYLHAKLPAVAVKGAKVRETKDDNK